MSGKFMKIKRIVIPTITLIIMTSQLLGCSSVTSKEMLDMLERQEAIVIEVPEPISQEQGTEIPDSWVELASLDTYEDFRTTFDDVLNISTFGIGGKNGCIYIDLDGNQTNNSTLYNAFMNEKFVENYWNNTDVNKKIIEASKGIYSDVESDKAALLAGYNGYFNIIADSEPGYANLNSTLTRLEAMTAIYKASTPVQEIEENTDFTDAIGENELAIYAQNIAPYSYLDYTNLSLDDTTANGTITRAEFIYMLVQEYYSDEYKDITGKETCYTDAKNAGNIAEKVGFITKDKKTGKVTKPDRWQSYELSYSIQNEDKGLTTDLYKAMVVAKNHNLITGDECRWSDGLTKGEALNLIVTVYQDLADTNGYINNADRGNATGESVSDSTIVEESTNGSLDVDITEDNKLFDPDKVGKRGDQFWFEDQATVDYLMGISGVSELPEKQLNQFMSDIAEMVSIDEFGGDIGKIEDYIQTVLPVYQQQSSTTKNNNSNSTSTDTKTNNNSNIQQQEASNNNSNNESTPSNNTDSNINQSESQDINNNKVGTGDQYFFQDDPADWGGSDGSSANWQY